MHRRILGETGFQLGFGCVQLTVHPGKRRLWLFWSTLFRWGLRISMWRGRMGLAGPRAFLGNSCGGGGIRLRSLQVWVAAAVGAGREWSFDHCGEAPVDSAPRVAAAGQTPWRGDGKAGVFAPEAAIRSLETSLRELGTDYLDLLLLHEATLANAAGEPLLEALEKEVAKGTIRHIGVASDFRKLEENDGSLPARYEVVQFNDNA